MKNPYDDSVVAEFPYGPGDGDGCARGRIVVDDHCYVLQHSGPNWKSATHWFPAAVKQLHKLPMLPDAAKLLTEMN